MGWGRIGGDLGEGVAIRWRYCSVQSSSAVSRLSIDSVDVVQSAEQLFPLQQVLTAL